MAYFELISDSEPATDHEVILVGKAIATLASESSISLNVNLVARLLKRLEEAEEEASQDPASALITFLLEDNDIGSISEVQNLLHTWNEGNFAALRRSWPELPEEVYIGADPLHKKTIQSDRSDDRYKAAWEETHKHLAWLQEKGQVPAKYLGKNLAEILTLMYREAQDNLQTRFNRDVVWARMHELAVSKGYDHVEYAVRCAPVYRCDCMGAQQVARNDGSKVPCECVAAANEPTTGRKLHLVWNAPRNECVGFIDEPDAIHAATGEEPEGFESTLAIAWLDIYGEDGPLHMETVLVKEKEKEKGNEGQ